MNIRQETPSGGVQAPLHRRIAENLSEQVSSGKLRPGERLPSERQIARQFQASRATVRTALQHLEQAGLIARRERRSAIVSIRRDITPYLRIACSSSRLASLFGRLSQMQILPPRCQLQLIDLHQSGAMTQMVSQPATGADILLCDLEYVNLFRGRREFYTPLEAKLFSEVKIHPALQQMCLEDDNYIAVPLGFSPEVLYVNRSLTDEGQVDSRGAGWNWEQLVQISQQLTHGGRYGFQFRPSFKHVSALMTSKGGELYQRDGQVSARNSDSFEPTVRLIHSLVHTKKVTPILAKADQLNLFTAHRCAMALDGYEMYGQYREKLGDRLGVRTLPTSSMRPPIAGGFAMVVLAGGQQETALLHDLMRTLLNANSQRALGQLCAALPVREDLLNDSTLEELGLTGEARSVFLGELGRCSPVNLPNSAEHKREVESLFLELWLGLDNIESICRRFREL